MLINTEVDNDDDASICVHTAFSGLNGTDMCNVGMLLPLQHSVPASCLSSQQARQEGSLVPMGAGGWYILES